MGYLITIAGIFLGELFLKNHIEEKKTFQDREEIAGGKIIISKFHNTGACLNLGNKKQKLVAFVSVLFTILMVGVFLVTLTTHGNHAMKLGLALLLGGAFSNTYDRLKRKYVVDYVSFKTPWKKLNGIIFNISDFMIAIGAMMSAVAVIMNPNI